MNNASIESVSITVAFSCEKNKRFRLTSSIKILMFDFIKVIVVLEEQKKCV